ncbi:hypothetical protein N7454_009223 [Penicillium verhagenii]|nr:hypothetical protein N7454_009223 [Penicillium verhagenii]
MLRFFATHDRVQPCPRTPSETPANEKFGGIFNYQPASASLGEAEAETSGPPGLPVTGFFPLGRVGAKIVLDNTLVQYAACWSLLVGDGIIRFRLFWWGWRFTLFFSW